MNKKILYYKNYKEIKTIITEGKSCLHVVPCKEKSIKSHSISKYSLKIISSKKSELYYFKQVSFDNISQYNYRTFNVSKIGCSEASTCYMFCSKHDKELFLDIENKPISNKLDQIMLIHYRIITAAIYTRLFEPKIFDLLLKNDFIKTDKYKSHKLLNRKKNASIVLDLLLNERKEVYNELEKKITEKYNFKFIRLNHISKLCCSDIFTPEFDLYGTPLGLFHKHQEHFSITVSNDKTGGYLLLICHKKFKFSNLFMDQINNKNKHLIVQYIFCYSNNFYFSIEWWDNLSIIKQKKLMYYYTSRYFPNLEANVEKENELSNDFRKYKVWENV